MIVGVGGQGSLLASRILGNLFIEQGLDVKLSEVHGMAQRGGSVVTYIRAGKDVASPLIEKGEADVIISFEELEAIRYLPWLKKNGKLIVNTQKIPPMPVLSGAVSYPENPIDAIAAKGVNVYAFDAIDIALKLGNAKAANVALLGVAAKVIGFEYEQWTDAIKQTVKPKFIELNLNAFKEGYSKF
ncbi:MAG: indolepyruvate oxidoreductase subunit beta [Clostridiales bacterium]|nr:indolepyruvate oxidoreductase subunit beta [Clostridiales bacterium]